MQGVVQLLGSKEPKFVTAAANVIVSCGEMSFNTARGIGMQLFNSGVPASFYEGPVEVCHAIARVVNAIGEQAPEWVAASDGDPGAIKFVEFALDCMRHPDRCVGAVCMDFWISLQDIPLASRHPSLCQPVYMALLEVVISQCTLHSDAKFMTDHGDDENGGAFRVGPPGCKELLESVFMLLEHSFVDAVVNHILTADAWVSQVVLD